MNIIIIGATSGIGKALFEKYVSEGNRVGIVGRRSHLLEELRQKHPANTVAVTADITKLEETESALKALLTELQDIDLAIVCSGTGDINATLDYAVERPTIDTNVVGWTFVIDSLYHIFERSKDTDISQPSPPSGDCAANLWHLPTAQRKLIKSTIWKPCARRLSRQETRLPSPTSVPALLIRRWQRVMACSG